MEKGQESLKLEIARRQARTKAELDAIPSPPPPAAATVPLLVFISIVTVLIVLAIAAFL